MCAFVRGRVGACVSACVSVNVGERKREKEKMIQRHESRRFDPNNFAQCMQNIFHHETKV